MTSERLLKVSKSSLRVFKVRNFEDREDKGSREAA